MFLLTSLIGVAINILSFVSLEFVGALEFLVFGIFKSMLVTLISLYVFGSEVEFFKFRAVGVFLLGLSLIVVSNWAVEQYPGYCCLVIETILDCFLISISLKPINLRSSTKTQLQFIIFNFQISATAVIFYCSMLLTAVRPSPRNQLPWADEPVDYWANWNILIISVVLLSLLHDLLPVLHTSFPSTPSTTSLPSIFAIWVSIFLSSYLHHDSISLTSVTGGLMVALAIVDFNAEHQS